MGRIVGTDASEKVLLYNPYQQAAWEALAARTPAGGRRFRTITMFAGRRGGKALDIETPIPTPDGWRRLAEIREGDRVFDEQGKPTTVTFITDVMWGRPCYEVSFSDGSVLVADAEHQWLSWDKVARRANGVGRRIERPAKRARSPQTTPRVTPRVVTTLEMLNTLNVAGGEVNHAVALSGALEYGDKALPVDPYVLGVWLGDGSKSAGIIHAQDAGIYAELEAVGHDVRRVAHCNRVDSYSVGTKPGVRDAGTGRMVANGSLWSSLVALGVANNKHVPRLYLEGSVKQRTRLLQGLMDTDGYADARGKCEFVNTNLLLSEAVLELALGLGYRAVMHEKRVTLNGRYIGQAWRVCFAGRSDTFKLARKAARCQKPLRQRTRFRYVTAITPVASVPVRCLTVDAPSHLFLAGRSCIPTHNTLAGGKATSSAMALPKAVVYVAAPTYGKLLDFVWPAVWEFTPRAWVEDWNEQRQEMRLTNGCVVRGRSMDDPNWLRGPGPDFVWADEIRETSKASYDAASPALVDRKGVFFVTTTANGFDWVYHEFWKKAVDGEPGYWACRYKTSDNPAIDPKEIEAKKRQFAANPAFFRQEFESDFVTFTGAVYGELVTPQILEHDDDIRKVIPEWPRINPSRPVLAGIDPGSDHPFGMVLGVSTERGIVWIGEYLERNRPTIEHVRGLEPILRRDNPAQPWEPSPWAIDRSAKQMSIELWQHGIRCAAAENDVMAGIQRVSSWLATKRMWFIRSRVPKLIDQMLSYRWAENTRPDGSAKSEKVIKVGDDLCDPVRYAMMLWPELPVQEISEHLGRRLIDFPEDQRWAVDRMNRCAALARGEDVPDDEMTGLLEPSDGEGPFANFW